MNPKQQLTTSDTFSWNLPKGYGKYEFHERWFHRDNPLDDMAPECFIFSRKAVDERDTTVIHWLVAPSRLARLRGRIHFSVDGYGDDDRELYEIPAVRSFFAQLLKHLPCGIYFASMADSRPIQFLAACTCDPLLVVRARDSKEICLQTLEKPLHRFCLAGFKCHTLFCGMVDVALSESLEHFATVVRFLGGCPEKGKKIMNQKF